MSEQKTTGFTVERLGEEAILVLTYTTPTLDVETLRDSLEPVNTQSEVMMRAV